MGRRQCELEGCTKRANQDRGSTPHVLHRARRGRRCQTVDCTKAAVAGGTPQCKAHGGGRPCQTVDCSKSALGDTGHCIAHGGGRRCQHEGCFKSALGDTGNCIAHGGGCQEDGCVKGA
jgi:hypothetical protein